MKTVNAVDLFCGAGGTSQGLVQACQKLGIKLDLLAINHWDVAIQTHSANHPDAEHLCKAIDDVDPLKVVPSGRLKLLVASPECTHFSTARGGKPMDDQSRASAWDILRWAEKLWIEHILIENVKEFRTWGPLDAKRRPMKSKKGALFQAFITKLEALGYYVEHRVLNAADYGAPTTRERLFIIAKRGRSKKIQWPVPTHTSDGRPIVKEFFGEREEVATQKWRTAREIIDWDIEGQSIFTRKRPLAPATIERIIAGLKKFGGKNAEPFIVTLRQHMTAQSVDAPLPTISTSGSHHALVQPFVLGQQSGAAARSVDDPLPTVATDGAIAMVQPFLLSVDRPVTNRSMPRTLDEPVPTVTGTPRIGMIEPFIVPQFGEREGQAPRTHSIEDPLPTITSHGAGALVEPFLVTYNKNSVMQTANEPLSTVTCKDRFGLVEAEGTQYAIDIRFRMLQPHELAAAMSFPKGYRFTGNREKVVKQIGNAVPVDLAEALATSLLQAA